MFDDRWIAVATRLAATSLVITASSITFAATPAAFAHGGLAVSSPTNGGTLTAPQESVTLSFTEKPAPFAFFSITAPTGERVDRRWSHGEPMPLQEPVREYQLVSGVWQPQLFHTGFPAKVPVAYWPQQGQYVVRYQSVASDDEPVKGEVRFTYSGAVIPAPAGWQPPTDQPSQQLLAPAGPPQQGRSAVPTTNSAIAGAQAAGPTGIDRTWLWLAPALFVLAVIVVIAVTGSRRSGSRARRR
jgi:methionine-rich copper-binding protein CopC